MRRYIWAGPWGRGRAERRGVAVNVLGAPRDLVRSDVWAPGSQGARRNVLGSSGLLRSPYAQRGADVTSYLSGKFLLRV